MAEQANNWRNEASFDRVARVLLGVAVLSLAFIGPQTAWGFLGLIFIVTGLVGFCPIYRVLGVSTCKDGECQSA